MVAPVNRINTQTDGKPAEEAQPRKNRQAHHQEAAEKHAGNGGKQAAGRAESTVPVWFLVAKDDYANRNQDEREEGADVGKVGQGSDVKNPRRDSYNESGNPRCRRRSPKARMYAAEQLRHQAVSGHGEPDTRLSELEHEQRGDHPHHRAE